METLIQGIARAKAAIDHGFSRIGSRLSASDLRDEALVGGAGRMIALSNATVLLCKNNQTAEAVFLLRPLVATGLAMRALAAGESHSGAELSDNLWDLDWKEVFCDPQWKQRLASAGVSAEQLAASGAMLTSHEYSNMYGGAFGVPWSHIYQKHQIAPPSAEAVLKAALQGMMHALKGLEARWPGMFAGAEA